MMGAEALLKIFLPLSSERKISFKQYLGSKFALKKSSKLCPSSPSLIASSTNTEPHETTLETYYVSSGYDFPNKAHFLYWACSVVFIIGQKMGAWHGQDLSCVNAD